MAQDTTTFDLTPLNRILGKFGSQKGAVIPILQRIQDAWLFAARDFGRGIETHRHSSHAINGR